MGPLVSRSPSRVASVGRSGTRLRLLRATMAVGLALLAATPLEAGARVRVVASTYDLGSIASAVGGERVEVAAIARPNSDPHRVEVLPSYMVRVSRADLYLAVGMGLDQWAAQIIDGSHNADVRVVDCSEGIDALERPSGRVDASMGDVHPQGNPHYWLDPRNAAKVAQRIAAELSRLDPEGAAGFAGRAERFAAECGRLHAEGRAAVERLSTREIVSYHRSWVYLADALGFTVAATIEPVPGIPPTARHLQSLVTLIREHEIPVVFAEPYFSNEATDFLHRETGIEVHRVSPSCGETSAESYVEHMARLIDILAHCEVHSR